MGSSKKRKAAAAPTPSIPTGPDSSDFFSTEAESLYRVLMRRKILRERGIADEQPFHGYIRKHRWETFCERPRDANVTMATEFYANMRNINKEGDVLCRGKQVRVSPDVINRYYGLKSYKGLDSDYENLQDEATVDRTSGALVGNWKEVVRGITRPEVSMDEILPFNKWSNIEKKYLTVEMNMWYSFVATRLSPVTINSEVQWVRMRMLYAIKKAMGLDVGKIIFSSMMDSSSGWGFHSLVTGLCHRAGCVDRMYDTWKAPMSTLRLESFQRKNKTPVTTESEFDLIGRFGRLEKDVRFGISLSEHTAKLLAHAFPESLAVVGPYPTSGTTIDDESGAHSLAAEAVDPSEAQTR